MIALLHAQRKLTVVSNLGQLGKDCVVHIIPRVSCSLKPMLAHSDLAYVHKSVSAIARVLVFDTDEEAEFDNLNDSTWINLTKLEIEARGARPRASSFAITVP